MTETKVYSRQAAWELLSQYVESRHLLKHVLAVEAAMVAYAKQWGEDQEKWAAAGLLHDLDYEKFPEDHPHKAVEILQTQGYSQDFIQAIKAHADLTEPREARLAKALYAVDELASFVVACALVRPDRSFNSLEVKSVKKKFKDKAFAKAVDREVMKQAAAELQVDLTEHIQTVINGLREHEEKLRAQGLSLID